MGNPCTRGRGWIDGRRELHSFPERTCTVYTCVYVTKRLRLPLGTGPVTNHCTKMNYPKRRKRGITGEPRWGKKNGQRVVRRLTRNKEVQN